MTIKERINEAVEAICEPGASYYGPIEKAIRAAVAEEREACAKVADACGQFSSIGRGPAEAIAVCIRQREVK